MTRLESVTHVSLILLATVASGILITDRMGIRLPQWGQSPRDKQVYETKHETNIGRKFPMDEGEVWVSDLNVVLALRWDCPYCKASLPLYRRILDLAGKSGSRITVQVVTREDPVRLREFLKAEGLNIESISRKSLADLGVMGTPTILLVDSSGTIQDELIGLLPAERADALIRNLANGN